jgi:hypothetical protein
MGSPGIHFFPTREDVHGGITILGPRMDGQMGFSDDYNAANSVGVEEVEYALNNGGSAGDRGTFHDPFDAVRIIEDFAITSIELRQEMTPQRFHWSTLLSGEFSMRSKSMVEK